MDSDRLSQQIHFIVQVDKLKHVLRQSYLIHAERRENSAEHSWHLAIAAMLLADYANAPLDLLRVLKMLLIHDIIEIDAGDTYCFDHQSLVDKAARERQAASRLFGLLPDDQASELRELWKEFDVAQTPEARFAVAIDRLMPLLHNFYTAGKSWQMHGITRDREIERNACMRDGAVPLWEFAQTLIQDAVAKGYLLY